MIHQHWARASSSLRALAKTWRGRWEAQAQAAQPLVCLPPANQPSHLGKVHQTLELCKHSNFHRRGITSLEWVDLMDTSLQTTHLEALLPAVLTPMSSVHTLDIRWQARK